MANTLFKIAVLAMLVINCWGMFAGAIQEVKAQKLAPTNDVEVTEMTKMQLISQKITKPCSSSKECTCDPCCYGVCDNNWCKCIPR